MRTVTFFTLPHNRLIRALLVFSPIQLAFAENGTFNYQSEQRGWKRERERETSHKLFFFFVCNEGTLNTSALWSLMSPVSYDWTRAGASSQLVPLLWNSHTVDCLRCTNHVDLCRIERDNRTMAYAHRLMPELQCSRWPKLLVAGVGELCFLNFAQPFKFICL